MIEFPLLKYTPTDFYTQSNTLCLLCHVRKKHIVVTPEEKVRQALVRYLVEEKGYPLKNFLLEEQMSRYTSEAKGRADIIIIDDTGYPLLLIECKDGSTVLTDAMIEQVLQYNKVIDADMVMIANGSWLTLVVDVDTEQGYAPIVSIPTYKEALERANVEVFMPPDLIIERPNFTPPLDQWDIDFHIEDGIFGKDTNASLHPFLLNFVGWLFDENDRVDIENKYLGKLQDMGLRRARFGNAAGGMWVGDYRFFNYRNEVGNDSLLSISVMGTEGSEAKNGKERKLNGFTYLTVAVNKHHSLQLRIDKFCRLKEHTAEIWHDGTITVGKLGQRKRKEVIAFIREKAPYLVNEKEEILLGNLEYRESITSTQPSLQDFIERILHYSILRDELREQIKTTK